MAAGDTCPVFVRITNSEMATKYRKLRQYCFWASPSVPPSWDATNTQLQEKLVFDDYTLLGLDATGNPVVGGAVTPMTQCVRGHLYSMGGITSVVSDPTVRRKGYIHPLFASIFKYMKDAEVVFSCLHPFRQSFYERLGYYALPFARVINFSSEWLSSFNARTTDTDEYTFHRVDLFEEPGAIDRYLAVRRKLQPNLHGFAIWSHIKSTLYHHYTRRWGLFVTNKAGDDVGLMTYEITGSPPPIYTKVLSVDEFLWTNVAVRQRLLTWLARHIDQTGEISLRVRSDQSPPEMWCTDLEHHLKHVKFSKCQMARIVDVDKALNGLPIVGTAGSEGQSLREDESVVVRVVDMQCSWNCGVFLLAADLAANCVRAERITQPSDSSAAVEMSIQAVTALVYVGGSAQTIAELEARGWCKFVDNHNSEKARTTLARLFPHAVPDVGCHF